MNIDERQWLAECMDLRPLTPASKRDGIEIKICTIPAGVKHCVVSIRNALFTGQPPLDIKFSDDVDIRHLSYEHGEWMTDTPQEIWQMYGPLSLIDSTCNVLVGGLGLGVFSQLVVKHAGANALTVEKDERIISAVAPFVSGKVVQDDIYHFADRVENGKFDVAFLDTWQSTGEYCWMTEVVPLRRKIGSKIPVVMCWQEDEMCGQIRMGALNQIAIPDHRQVPSNLHYRVLRKVAEKEGIVSNKRLPKDSNKMMATVMKVAGEVANIPEFHYLVDRFLDNPGSDGWEEEFGAYWDEFTTHYHKYRDNLRKRFPSL